MNWKFDRRPGGWIVAESESGQRRRVYLYSTQGKGNSKNTKSILVSRGLTWTKEWENQKEENEESDSSLRTDNPLEGGGADLFAQFPGKVRKVLIQAGENVLNGTALLLVEAMKMEFTIRAPFSGKVIKILIQEGQQVSPGDQFIELLRVDESLVKNRGVGKK